MLAPHRPDLVAEPHRRARIGAQLMTHDETAARARACLGVHVSTGSFKAPGPSSLLQNRQLMLVMKQMHHPNPRQSQNPIHRLVIRRPLKLHRANHPPRHRQPPLQ